MNTINKVINAIHAATNKIIQTKEFMLEGEDTNGNIIRVELVPIFDSMGRASGKRWNGASIQVLVHFNGERVYRDDGSHSPVAIAGLMTQLSKAHTQQFREEDDKRGEVKRLFDQMYG